MSDATYNVFFLCTGNRAHSVLGEAVINKPGKGRFRASSAASRPTGEVHPMELSVLGGLDEMATRRKFREIGQGEGASTKAGVTR